MIENTTHKNYQERRRPPTMAMVASLNADNDETTLLLSVPTDNNSGNNTSLRKRHYLATALVVAVISMMGTLLVVCVTNIHTQVSTAVCGHATAIPAFRLGNASLKNLSDGTSTALHNTIRPRPNAFWKNS